MRIIYTFLFFVISIMNTYGQDWANLNRYKEANLELGASAKNEKRVVFMGNSITEGWSRISRNFFKGKSYINRGISGQTTPQMLVRFRPDVLELNPEVVVILAGTNDIAGNTGPMTIDEIFGNIRSMAELAKVNDIEVIISSVLPAYDYPWKPGLEPNKKIPSLNLLLKKYAERNDMIYLDYFTAMADDRNGLPESLANDGVHPTIAGYRIMEILAEKAIAEAFKRQAKK